MITNPLQGEPNPPLERRPFLFNLMVAARLAAQAVMAPVAYGAHAMVEDEEGRVLLVRHTYAPGWYFPGGGVNRGEPAGEAVIRELREEIGLTSFAHCALFGLYTRRHFWATNVIALFHLTGVTFDFKPNVEIAEAKFYPLDAPPADIGQGPLRRFQEHAGKRVPNGYW